MKFFSKYLTFKKIFSLFHFLIKQLEETLGLYN